jgi:hypothetical protein
MSNRLGDYYENHGKHLPEFDPQMDHYLEVCHQLHLLLEQSGIGLAGARS